jgi:hypothetical protein
MVVPWADDFKFFISPTNAHKFILDFKIIKTIKITKAAPTCFGLHKPSYGRDSQSLAKITLLVPVYLSL